MDQNNFSWLLLALLVYLIGVPIVDDLTSMSGPVARALMFSSLLVIGVWSLRGSGRAFTMGITLVIVGIIFSFVTANTSSLVFAYAASAAFLGFLLVAISFTLRQVVVGTEISANRLIGAVCIYLLLGVIWAVAYSTLELIAPDSFQGFQPLQDRGWDSEWLYFSFVTMTTLGYGDITPVSATARALAYMQAVFGQFYIAMLVAGLVSAYISNRQNPGGNGD